MPLRHASRSFIRELQTTWKQVNKEFAGQVELALGEKNGWNRVNVYITPNRGPYAHACFEFELDIPSDYPNEHPTVTCITDVYHPNMLNGSDGWVCLNILSEWNSRYGLLDLLHGLLFLFYEPNIDDPFNIEVKFDSDPRVFECCIITSLRGQSVHGVEYAPNEAWCRWASQHQLVGPIETRSVDLNSITLDERNLQENSRAMHALYARQQSTISAHYCRVLSGQYTPLSPTVTSNDFENKSEGVMYPTKNDFFFFPIRIKNRIAYSISEKPWFHWMQFYYVEPRCESSYLFTELCELDRRVLPIHLEFRASPFQRSQFPSVEFLLWCISMSSPGSISSSLNEESCKYPTSDAVEAADGESTAHTDDQASQDLEEVQCTLDNIGDEFHEKSSDIGKIVYLNCDIETLNHRTPDYERLDQDCAKAAGNEVHQYESHDVDESSEHHSDAAGGAQSNVECDELDVPGPVGSNSGDTDEHEASEHSNETVERDNEANEVNSDMTDSQIMQFSDHATCYANGVQEVRKVSSYLWFMFQTRWPPIITPGHGIRFKPFNFVISYPGIPSYSSFRLFVDLVVLYKGMETNKSLILIDSLTLSPFAPILNHLQIGNVPESPEYTTLFSLEWISVINLLRFRSSLQSESMDAHLHGVGMVAILSLISNWFEYFSRVELGDFCFGYPRPRRSDPGLPLCVACIYPRTLGCGRTPLFDAWPLVALTHSIRTACWLFVCCSHRLLSFFGNFRPTPHIFYAFADYDLV